MTELLNLYPHLVCWGFFSLFWGLVLFSMIVPVKHKGIDNYKLYLAIKSNNANKAMESNLWNVAVQDDIGRYKTL